ncbi:hypothetical protein DENSPDRAFT_423221 [Dentipellis sp. KUC8613]|nr:hypothetical protein DENSPDRAFT_423221 [Dentipellis sp. KUC8613]
MFFGGESIVQVWHDKDTGQIVELKSKTRDQSRRVLSRIMVEPYGWPLKFFKDRMELLVCLRDAIKAHRSLYRRGVLHRDISTGNILICPFAGDARKAAGLLFDLDCGKRAERDGTSETAVVEVSSDDMEDVEMMIIKRHHAAGIERAALERLLSFFPEDSDRGLSYLRAFLRDRTRKLLQSPLTYADIGLLPEDEAAKLPKFITHKFEETRLIGTGPFISSELAVQLSNLGTGHLVHDSIHDMESTMWVLVFLCCTRDGPGGRLRKELGEEFRTSHQLLQAVVYYFFEASVKVMGSRKQILLCCNDKTKMEELLLANFHDYFTPLKPLVRKWFEILSIGYRYRIYETIHDQFLEAIEEAIDEEEKRGIEENAEIRKATDAELERRRIELEKLSISPQCSGYTESREGSSPSTLLQSDQSPSRPLSKIDRALFPTSQPAQEDLFKDASQSEHSEPEPKKAMAG